MILSLEGSLVIGGELNCSGQCEDGSTTFTGDGTITAGGGCTGDWGDECEEALPVKLLDFNLAEQEGMVIITWATSMEENFHEFVVQRSENGILFEDIGEVAGQGFDVFNIVSKYSFTDKVPLPGYNYYRLKAVDLDGAVEYFKIIVIKLEVSKKLCVYPNPGRGNEIHYKTNFNSGEDDRIVITNQLGSELINVFANESDSIIIPDKPLQPGVYFLRYVSEDFEKVLRIVIVQ
jgi:hypothetical protein